MHRPHRILIIHDVPSQAASLAGALRSGTPYQVETVGALDAGLLRARDEVFAAVFLSIVLADPRKGGLAEIRRRIRAPLIFTLPGSPAAGAFHLEAWEWVAEPFVAVDVQRALQCAMKVQGLEERVASAQKRVKDEEQLADKGRVAARAAQDFERLLKQIGDGLMGLRHAVPADNLGHLTALETAVGRAERLCQQLYGPTAAAAVAQQSAQAASTPKPVQVSRPLHTILVVDDEESIRELAACVVAQVGWNVVSARDGEEALLRFQAEPHRFSAALVDLSLPRLTGVEVINGIRAIRPNLPVILVSGHGGEALTHDPRLALHGMLRKPFSTDALKAALSKVVKECAQKESRTLVA